MMTTNNKKNILTIVASFVGSIITVLSFLVLIGQPHFEREVKKVFFKELNGAEVELFFQAKALEKEKEYKEKIKENSAKSFRVLCGDKLGVPFDEAHIEIGNLKLKIIDLEKTVKDLQDCCNRNSRNRHELLRN